MVLKSNITSTRYFCIKSLKQFVSREFCNPKTTIATTPNSLFFSDLMQKQLVDRDITNKMLIILTKLLVYLPWFHLIGIFLPNVLLSLFTKIIGLEITLDVHVLGIYHLDHCARENPGTVLNKNIVVWLQGFMTCVVPSTKS